MASQARKSGDGTKAKPAADAGGEVLRIEGDWQDATRKAVTKKKPAGGWPQRTVKKRKKRKP